jgi:hypothetical protein
MKILIACEESQEVCKAFRSRGHEAYSCDLQDCSGGHPEWHIKEDCLEVLKDDWDLKIGFPPCTDLAVSGARWFKEKIANGRQKKSIDFFLKMAELCNCIENPIGIMSKIYRKPDQIIHPYYFGDPSRKATCLWLRGIPKLFYRIKDDLFDKKTIVDPDIYVCKNGKTFSRDYIEALKAGNERGKLRSKTYSGIAKAMAEQWS